MPSDMAKLLEEAREAAREWLHAYGINTSRYTTGGGDHPMMDSLPEAFLKFALRTAAPAPAGVVVPRVPTVEMLDAAEAALKRKDMWLPNDAWLAAYRALLSAAPAQPTDGPSAPPARFSPITGEPVSAPPAVPPAPDVVASDIVRRFNDGAALNSNLTTSDWLRAEIAKALRASGPSALYNKMEEQVDAAQTRVAKMRQEARTISLLLDQLRFAGGDQNPHGIRDLLASLASQGETDARTSEGGECD